MTAMTVPEPTETRRGPWDRLYDGFVDTGSDRSLSTRFRARRWAMLLARFPDLADMTVLDLGGTVESWSVAPVRPARLTMVNRDQPNGSIDPGVEFLTGDVCDLTGSIRAATWDLVFSNSVIEHPGGHQRRVAFADGVRAFGTHHWIQTPYRYFPIEPHFLFPGLQFLPTPARATVIQRWPLNKWRPDDRRTAMEAALDLELLGRAELQHYFPDSRVETERLGGLPKSLIVTD